MTCFTIKIKLCYLVLAYEHSRKCQKWSFYLWYIYGCNKQQIRNIYIIETNPDNHRQWNYFPTLLLNQICFIIRPQFSIHFPTKIYTKVRTSIYYVRAFFVHVFHFYLEMTKQKEISAIRPSYSGISSMYVVFLPFLFLF